MENEGDCETNCIWCTLNDPKSLGKRTGSLINKTTSEDHIDCSISLICQRTEKSPEHLR